MISITTEEVEALAEKMRHTLAVVAFDETRRAAAALCALAAERDQLRRALSDASRARGEAEGKLAASDMAGVVEGWKARAERAEAETERLSEAWRAFDRIVESNIRRTDGPHRIKDEAGNWHEGPAVDICFKVLRKGQEFARATATARPEAVGQEPAAARPDV